MKQINWDEFIKEVCALLGLDEDKMNKDTNIYDDIGIDSLGAMTLGLKLQRTFNKKVPLSATSLINTLGDIYEVFNKSEDS
ncbi:MAG: acyl carrier protein [Spirochaetales bacterium]|nr:acyl carrier protein [Spirochaetales bacterium]